MLSAYDQFQLISKESFKFKSKFTFLIGSATVTEERALSENSFFVSLQESFTIIGNMTQEQLVLLPMIIPSEDVYKMMLYERCYFCKYQNISLDTIIPILKIEDIFEFLDFYFQSDNVKLSEDFLQNKAFYYNQIMPNYTKILISYVLTTPTVICKICFTNKMNLPSGIKSILNVLKKETVKEDMLQINCNKESKKITKRNEHKLQGSAFIVQLSNIEMTKVSKKYFSLLSKMTINSILKNNDNLSATLNNNILSIGNALKHDLSISNELSKDSKNEIITQINSICIDFYKSNSFFFLSHNPNIVLNLINEIKLILQIMHQNLITKIKEKNILSECFENMISFKDDMLIIKKLNVIFEYIIKKIKLE